MRLRLVFTVAAFVTIAAAWGVSAQSLDPADVKEPAASPEINLGKLSYQAFCQECHGVNGVGTDKGPPFLHRIYNAGHHGDRSFYMAVKNGTSAHHWPYGDMKPVPGVSEAHVKNIIAYVRALQKVNGF